MSTPTDRLPPFEVRRPGLRPWTADGTRREPPGEGLPPVNPLLGRLEPDAAEAHAAHAQSETLASIRTYLALLAQRAAPLNEQVYQGSGVLVAGAPTDLDMGQVPAGIFTRIHRVVIVGSIPGDTPTVSLYPDGVAVGNAIAAWQFGGTPNPPLYATSGVVAAAGSPAATLPNAAGQIGRAHV